MKTTEQAKKELADFEAVARPLIKYLAENYHPHTMAIVESDKALLFEGLKTVVTDDYLLD